MQVTNLKRIALHTQVATGLRTDIYQKLCEGDRLDSESDLAKRFGVSNRTIREALSVLAHEGLIERRHGSGTYVAERKSRQHVAVMLGVHSSYPWMSHYSFRIIEALHQIMADANVGVRTYLARYGLPGSHEDPIYEELLRNLSSGCVSGIYVGQGSFEPKWLDLIRRSSVPCVGDECEYRVQWDLSPLIGRGTRHLLDAGRRKIAYMDPSFPEGLTRKCLAAYRQVLKEYDVAVHECWIRTEFHPYLTAAGYSEFKEIWVAEDEKPDGLLVCDDVLFTDVAKAITEIGIRVPDQLMVVTHANRNSTIHHPFPTTKIETDPEQLALVAGRMLLQLIRGEAVPEKSISLPLQWTEQSPSAELSMPANTTRLATK